MSAPRHTGRLRRSFAAVESSYVRDLGDRDRRVRVEIADSRPRHLVALTSGITWLAVGRRYAAVPHAGSR
jgi:hypothetical protein